MEENPHYTCSSKDCNLRFTSESHLQVHKKKHEMVLTLGKTTLTTSDQTPTPTTFIRNCEEVGLFQDLRNVNPFEETFRKAAEAVRTGTILPHSALTFSTHGADDTLHTPHVFPNIVEAETVEKSSGTQTVENKPPSFGNRERVVKSEADTSLKISSLPALPQNEVVAELNATGFLVDKNGGRGSEDNVNANKRIQPQQQQQQQKEQQPDQNVQVLLKMPDGTLLQISTQPVNLHHANMGQVAGHASSPLVSTPPANNTVILNTQTLAPHQHSPQDSTSIVKQKLKQALLSGLKPSPKPLNKVPINGNPQMALPSSVGGQAGVKGKRVEAALIRRASSSTNSEEDANEEKRRKALERNRAAAMRCRERRKAWVAELRRNADSLKSTNFTLNQEVTYLRSEVARLKALLLTHRNCPVTLAAIANGGHGGEMATEEENMLSGKAAVVMLISKKPEEEQCLLPIQQHQQQGQVQVEGQQDVVVIAPVGGGSKMRERLSLDIEQARQSTPSSVDLDSPLVRSDEVLSSVAPPTTPNEADKIVTFPDEHMDIDSSDNSNIGVLDEKPLATPVIQLNPNAILRTSSNTTVPTITCPTSTKYR